MMKVNQFFLNLDSNRNRKRIVVLVFILFVAYAARYVTYLMTAGAPIPFMDYWRLIYKFGPSALNNDFSLSLFYKDGAEASQAGTLFLVFKVLVAHKFDMMILVYYGAILLPIYAFILMIEFWNRNKDVRWWEFLLGGVLTFVILLNYNAWELYTQNFIFSSAVGIILKYAFYRIFEGFLRKIEQWDNLRCAIACSLFCVGFTMYCLWFSAASFIGNTVVLAFVTFLWAREDKKYQKPAIRNVCIAISITCSLTIILYFVLASKIGGQNITESIVFVPVIDYIKGFLVGLGASVLPNSVWEKSGQPVFYIMGVFLLLWVILVVFLVIKKKLLRGNLLPLMYLVYSGVTIAEICVGRIGIYGVSVMTSSRYCVGSGLGLLGLVWLSCQVFKEKCGKNTAGILLITAKCLITVGCVVVIAGLLYAAKIEWGIAPWRAVSYQNLESIMRNIENYTDSQLGGFQSVPYYVRGAVEFLRNNHLSIFR